MFLLVSDNGSHRQHSAQTRVRAIRTGSSWHVKRTSSSHMPGAPAAGGWGGSNRTLGIEVEGFNEEEVVRASSCAPASVFAQLRFRLRKRLLRARE